MKKLIPENSILIPDQADLVFSGVLFDVYEWDQPVFDGSTTRYEMLKRTDTVSAICVHENKIIVLDDAQPHNGSHKTFPGGKVEAEDPSILAAAQREVLEESGYQFKNWRLIKVTQPTIEIEWFVYLLLAWDTASISEANPDSGERIVVNFMEFNQLKDLIMQSNDHMRHYKDLFIGLDSLNDLLDSPEYEGQTVDR